MSNRTGGQPGRGRGEPPRDQHDFGAETGAPDTGPHGTGRTDGGGGAGGPGGAASVADLEAPLGAAAGQTLRPLARPGLTLAPRSPGSGCRSSTTSSARSNTPRPIRA